MHILTATPQCPNEHGSATNTTMKQEEQQRREREVLGEE